MPNSTNAALVMSSSSPGPPWLAHKALRIDVPNRAGLGGTNLPGVLLSRSQGWARQIGKNHGKPDLIRRFAEP